MTNIDREYKETILSKYNSLDKILEKADETGIWSKGNLMEPTTIVTLTNEILDNELDEIKESIFKNDKSAYYLSAEAIRLLMESTEYVLEAINVYEVTEDKIDNTKLKLITLGDKEVNCKLDTKAVVTFSLNATLSIITSNLILVLDALGYYESWIDWLKHLDEVKVVTNNKIDIIKELEETKENSSYKALKERIVSFTKDNEEHINELIRQWQEELIENMNKMKH